MKNFIEEIENFKSQLSSEAQNFLETLKNESKIELTEKGQSILKAMQDNVNEYNNIFSAKQIGEILFMAPRSVSGSMRKLIDCEYVVKHSTSPVTYALTDLGKQA